MKTRRQLIDKALENLGVIVMRHTDDTDSDFHWTDRPKRGPGRPKVR